METMTSTISVLIVEDSAFMRIVLSDLLKGDERINLLGSAQNGKEGVEKIKKLHPDVVITDMVMPEYDGLYLVNRVMEEIPTPVILLSALDKSDTMVFDALSKGAFDFIDKPKDDITNSIKAKNYPLVDLVTVAAGADIEKKKNLKVRSNTFNHTFDGLLQYEAIVIGASTGGPGAIENLLQQLPDNLAVPVIIAQHMPHHFIESFAKRLDLITPLKVVVATKGEIVVPGKVYLAPGTGNILLKRHPHTNEVFFSFSKKTYKEFNNPSVDCLLESAALIYGKKAIGVILTGMGKDGTEGLKSIKDSGGITVVQDELTSVVYGMPKNALDTGAADRVIPIDQLGGYLISCL
jgi:two-component system chemotaxis response regulator CheB